jgi:NAD-reducing hydrogenase small subunit
VKPRVATIWLDGCSGCHMSLLDMDERLLALADRIELVYGPLVDTKIFPENVDVTLVEGAVSNASDLERIHVVRARTRLLVSLGDCAVTGNVPALRNLLPEGSVLGVYDVPPSEVVPALHFVRPVHQVVPVDLYLTGCPPSADVIHDTLLALVEGRTPVLGAPRFGN